MRGYQSEIWLSVRLAISRPNRGVVRPCRLESTLIFGQTFLWEDADKSDDDQVRMCLFKYQVGFDGR